jgi:transcription elongation factor GreA
MSDQQGEQLTRAEREQLEAELAELAGPRRQQIVEAIAVARAHGDLSENFEYHAAKNEQGLLERQITLLEQKLSAAVVIEKAASANVGTGSVVEFEDEDGDHVTITISNAGGPGTVSPHSPLGQALLGSGPGDAVTVHAPSARWTARVLSVS